MNSIGNRSAALRRACGMLFGFAAAMVAVDVAAKGTINPAPAETQTAFQLISSAGPLNGIYVGVDAATQVTRADDGSGQVYPSNVTPGDYGTFLVVADALYAPDMAGHGGTASANIGTYTAFTPISQSAVGGAGTAASPFTVTTQVGVGATGLTITQTDAYVVGQESFRTDVVVANGTGAPIPVLMYRAMDCYLGGSDSGYGLVTGTSPACTRTPNNVPADRIEQLVPLTGGNNYYQAQYGTVWTAIGSHQPFNNTCQCDSSIDNGAGISWNFTVPAGGSVTQSMLTVFSPLGVQALTVTKSADVGTVQAGGDDGYTITVTNPNSAAATLNSIIDTLPAGFTYQAGSTTGATTANPSVAGTTLTWAGPFPIAAGGTVTLHFDVSVSSVTGTYTNQATADAGADTVAGTGPTAPVTVVGGTVPPPTDATALPTLGESMLAMLVLLMLAAGVVASRRARG